MKLLIGSIAVFLLANLIAAYREAFRHPKNYALVDPARIFRFGMSDGGGFAPLVADGAPIKGYVVDAGWIKTWYEQMLEIERRRLALAGHRARLSPASRT